MNNIVQLYRGSGLRNWRIRLVSENGRILAVSEGYFSKWNAKRAAKTMFPDHKIVEVNANGR